MALKSYDAKDVIIIYGGITVKEFAEDTFLTISRGGNTYRDVVGCDGEITRLYTKDTRGDVRFSLAQTSESHKELSALFLGDELIGSGVLPFILRDSNGLNLAASAEAWVQMPPALTFGRGPSVWEWLIRCSGLRLFIGGTNAD